MPIVLLGATGFVGSALLVEALHRIRPGSHFSLHIQIKNIKARERRDRLSTRRHRVSLPDQAIG